MDNVSLIAKITAVDGRRGEVVAALDPMFDAVADEPGTEQYILHEDIVNPDVLWIYELYTDDAAFQAHSSSPAMAELIGALGGDLMGAPPELIMLRPVRSKGG